jgi:hypothetical protein
MTIEKKLKNLREKYKQTQDELDRQIIIRQAIGYKYAIGQNKQNQGKSL